MRNRCWLIAVMVAFAIVVSATLSSAQDVASVNLPFKFNIGKKVLDAGKYEFTVPADTTAALMITPVTGAPMVLPYITRLAAPETPLREPRFVFDKVGDEYFLSEIWLPDRDGYLIHDTKQPHSHHAVKGAKKG